MGKPGLGIFTARRKSQGNVFDDIDISASPDNTTANPNSNNESGGFRLLSRTEVDRAKEKKTHEKEKSKFPRFTGFSGPGSKHRNHSFDDDSAASSKRDSKSSSGTQFSTSRPYANGQHGSTSTLPSSADTSSDDNLFGNVPRPPVSHHNSSPALHSLKGIRTQLPSLPKSSSGVSSYKDLSGAGWSGRNRAMTTSSYASTAVPPKLEGDLNFGGFEDDMFSHLSRKESPELPRESVGRSLLSEKRTFLAEPIKIDPQRSIEPPLASWESRGSADNLMDSPRSGSESPPPPPPPHKYSTYAPVASESPTLHSPPLFQDPDAHVLSQSYMDRNSYRKTSPEPPHANSVASSSANSYATPYSSRSATASSTTTSSTPKASLIPKATPYTDADEEDLFTPTKPAPPKPEALTVRKSTAGMPSQSQAPPVRPTMSGDRVMSQAEFREYQKRQMTQPPPEDSSDEEDYEDEEDAIRKREEEELVRRKNQQMNIAREAMRRSTAPPGSQGGPGAPADNVGFPSETSMKADEWEDEDVPLGILAQHGFPSQARNRFPSQPNNAMPSYIPDRPASAGAMSQRGAGHANLPAFARNLPEDPYSHGPSFIGGGLVRHTPRESLGFNGFAQGPASIAGDSISGGMGPSPHMMYQDAGMSQPSLVDQIQMRDMSKQKYMGGASTKKPQGGPFTGMLGQQMNANGQAQNPTRVSVMPPMNPMMGGQMPMMGMGMNQMAYPMPQGNDYMQQMQQFQQMQQMIAMQQMQLQMMQQHQHQQQAPQQDPRISMALPNNGYAASTTGGGSFLNVPNAQNRPMSFLTPNANQPQQQRAMSFMGPHPGYTPSIAPSERSNIGLSARYRSVVNHSDAVSTGTSMTLQASTAVNQQQNRPGGAIKGILKKASPGPPVSNADDDVDEDWGKMAARKSKFKGKENSHSGLEHLARGLDI